MRLLKLANLIGVLILITSCTDADKNPRPQVVHTIKTISPTPVITETSLTKLKGISTNPYGIRDDILNYIHKKIPNSNKKATFAAIKYASYSQRVYYQSSSQQEAMAAENKIAVALACLDYALLNDDWITVSREIERLMKNTPEREKHMWQVVDKYFSGKILGDTNLTEKQIKQKCDNGEY